MPTEVAYAVTKGAIDALTRAIAPTLASRDITVNAVNPGPTDTGWLNAAVKETLRQRFPAGRVGLPKDAAQLVAFLASEAANWITGRILHSEGGVTRKIGGFTGGQSENAIRQIWVVLENSNRPFKQLSA